jgi:hypothetical protein
VDVLKGFRAVPGVNNDPLLLLALLEFLLQSINLMMIDDRWQIGNILED